MIRRFKSTKKLVSFLENDRSAGFYKVYETSYCHCDIRFFSDNSGNLLTLFSYWTFKAPDHYFDLVAVNPRFGDPDDFYRFFTNNSVEGFDPADILACGQHLSPVSKLVFDTDSRTFSIKG